MGYCCVHVCVCVQHLWKNMNFQDTYCFIREGKVSCTVFIAIILRNRNDSPTVSQLIPPPPDTQTRIAEIISKKKPDFSPEEWIDELDKMRSRRSFLALQFDTAVAWEIGSKFTLQQYFWHGNKMGFCDTATRPD